MKKGAITLIDVLGWRGICQRNENCIKDLIKIIDKANKIQTEMLEGALEKVDFVKLKSNIISISDSIAIITEGKFFEVIEFHGIVSAQIIIESLISNIPVRGAISFGEIENQNNVFAGKAVDEVASWYEQGQFIGIFQTPSVYLNPENDYNRYKYKDFITDYAIHTKKANLNTKCVNWPNIWKKYKKKDINDLKRILIEHTPITPDISTKFENTINFYKDVVNKG